MLIQFSERGREIWVNAAGVRFLRTGSPSTTHIYFSSATGGGGGDWVSVDGTPQQVAIKLNLKLLTQAPANATAER